jgi:signal transduction histidine kinase
LLKSLKINREDCLGKRLDQLDVGFTAEQIDHLYAAETIEAGAKIELQLYARDDQLRLIAARAQTIEVGTHRYLRITGQDMTDQRAGEQRRSALEVQLREAQRTEVIGQLAGGLAHDFNNILTAIIGNAELTGAQIGRDHPAQKSVGVIKKAGQRAIDQIRQITNLGNRDTSSQCVIEVFGVVAECMDLVKSQIPSEVEIRIEPPPALCRVMANSSHLHQILMNLLTNAVQAVGETGEVLIQIDPQTEGNTDDLSDNDPVVIEVIDNGRGIDPVNAGRIFDAFFTTKSSGMGAGIGLTLARTIARSYGGELSFSSTLGEGATFRLQLPRLPEGNESSANAQDPFGIRDGQAAARILFVDDDAEVLFTGAMMIEQLGHSVTSSSDPVAALESLSSADSNYDLLITDNMMPRLTGIELIQGLRQKGVNIPAVLVSGYGTAKTQIEKLGAHNATFVAKPFSMEEIASAINLMLAL